MQNLETRFFKLYGIKPLINKRATYNKDVSTVDEVYPEINGDTVLLLESCLGEFTVLRMIAPSEITAYAYKTDKIGKYAASRKDALLEFLIEYYELYKDTVPSVFSNQLVG